MTETQRQRIIQIVKTLKTELFLPLEVTYECSAGRPAHTVFSKSNCMLISAEEEEAPEIEIAEVLLNGNDIFDMLTPEQIKEIESECWKDAKYDICP